MIRATVTTTPFNAAGVLAEAMKNIAARIRRNLAAMTCPTHGEHPRVRMEVRGDQIGAHIEACCEEFKTQVLDAASRPNLS